MTKKPLLPLVATLIKETTHRLVVENPEKLARQNAQWQEELAKQVSDQSDNNIRALHKGKTSLHRI